MVVDETKTTTVIYSQIDNQEIKCCSTFKKLSPLDETVLYEVARSTPEDVDMAVSASKAAFNEWHCMSAVVRGKILLNIARHLEENKHAIAQVVARETGKAINDALGETNGAIQLAEFFAGEGMRLYGRTLQSGNPSKTSMTIKVPHGVVGLIIAANTPIANVAWKVFPALICGNTAVLKASEDAPATASIFARLAYEAGLPKGVLNILQGYGDECGMPLVCHPDVKAVSFTGSTRVGQLISEKLSHSMTRLSLELGGKNPLVVANDADLDKAVHWSLLSSFSNAGQRCAASSRIIVYEKIYDKFKDAFVGKTKQLKLGNNDGEIGPVIKQSQLDFMLSEVELAISRGGKLLCGGKRVSRKGYFMQPTILEVKADDPINDTELFGPITTLSKVASLEEAVSISNQTQYGLTAAIHTQNINAAMKYAHEVKAGAVNINAGTYGSEPHFPFGGFGMSGNGTREPGVEAIAFYTETKVVSIVGEFL